jgi:hypothetical protein
VVLRTWKKGGSEINMMTPADIATAAALPAFGAPYLASDLSLEEKDQIQSFGRRAYLQFVALDYIILRTYQGIASKVNDDPQNSKLKFTNPYNLDGEQLDALFKAMKKKEEERESKRLAGTHGSGSEPVERERQSKILKLFKDYMISLTVQRMISYALINTRRVFELKSIPLENLEGQSNIYATTDKLDKEVIMYRREALQRKILEEMENANMGMPLAGDVQEIISRLVFAIGDLTPSVETYVESEVISNPDQDKAERELVKELFFVERPDGSDTHHHDVKNKTYNDIKNKAAFQRVFKSFEDFLPDDGPQIINSGLFSNVIRIWSALFSESQPEIIDILTNLLPTIEDRFRSSYTTSEKQQDIRHEGLKIMIAYLEQSLTDFRLKELNDLLNDPAASSSLFCFRSLTALLPDINKEKALLADINKEKLDGKEIQVWNVHNGRLKFMRLVHWVLTDEKELGDIFRYALSLVDEEEKKDIFKDITPIEPAMFPGRLESADAISSAGTVLEMSFKREQQNKDTLLTRLKRAGGSVGALDQAKVSRWFP